MDFGLLFERLVAHQNTAGFLGSLLSLQWAGEGWKTKLFSFACGTAAWAYIAPAMVVYLGVQTTGVPHLVSLMCGMFGMRAATRAVEAFDKVDIADWIARFLPRKEK